MQTYKKRKTAKNFLQKYFQGDTQYQKYGRGGASLIEYLTTNLKV
jgi:hypothetical protein